MFTNGQSSKKEPTMLHESRVDSERSSDQLRLAEIELQLEILKRTPSTAKALIEVATHGVSVWERHELRKDLRLLVCVILTLALLAGIARWIAVLH